MGIQLPCNIDREQITCRILSNSKLLIEAPILPRKSFDNDVSQPRIKKTGQSAVKDSEEMPKDESPINATDYVSEEEQKNQAGGHGDPDVSVAETEMKSETRHSEPKIDESCSEKKSDGSDSEVSNCDSFVIIEDSQEKENENPMGDEYE